MARSLSDRKPSDADVFGNLSQREFLHFLDDYRDCDAAIALAVAGRKDLRAKIKASGIPLSAFDRHRKDAEISAEVRERENAWYQRLMTWRSLPVGFQTSADFTSPDEGLMALNASELKRIADEGKAAGRAGKRRDTNPHRLATEAFQRWDQNWLSGQSEIASTLAPKRGRRSAARPDDEAPPVVTVAGLQPGDLGGGEPAKRGRGRPRKARPESQATDVGAGTPPLELVNRPPEQMAQA